MYRSFNKLICKLPSSFFALGAVIFLFSLSSCNTTKFLKEDELLLKDINTRISNTEKINNPSELKGQLEQFYLQEPNGRFLFVPREWFWFRNQAAGDTTWIKKWSRNVLGEQPAILDRSLVEQSRSGMEMYLRNKKGFYNAVVRDTIKTRGKLAEVTFKVNPGKRYTINKLHYVASDSGLTMEARDLQKSSLLSPGDPIDALTFEFEMSRMATEMQNRGYADFNLNYIDLKGDSTGLDSEIDIFFELLPRNDGQPHRKYRVGEIEIYTDYHQFQNEEDLESEVIFGNKYYRQSDNYIVKPSVINRKIFLDYNETYRARDYSKTIKKLFSLGTYRFVKINPSISPRADSIIDYKIFLTPQNKKWIFDLGTDIFFSNISRVDRNLVGFAVGTGLTNRNALGGSERFKFSFETGVEFTAGTPIETNTFSLGLNNSLEIPKVTRTLNTIVFLNKVGIIKDRSMQVLRDEGRSNVTLGYNFLDILNNYKISSFNVGYGYDFRPNKKHRLVYNQIGFNLTDYTVRDSFQQILITNPLQQRRFETSFFSGLFFKDMSYYYQSDNGPYRSNYAFITELELSGLEVFLANKAYNAASGSNSTWRLNNNIDFEKHIKFSVDGRWNRRIINSSRLASRIKVGVAVPYGGEENVVSFIKQLLVGGPNSIRAWRPMQLGPGSFEFMSQNDDPIFFQRGDLSLEFSLEYRFDLFWLLEGALFFDGGNIWTLKEDTERPGAQFGSDFYNEIALGYGYGLRWDFSYFIIRFDFGFKLRSPFIIEETNSHWIPFNGQGIFGNANVAINYPF